MIKGSIQEEDITIINLYAPNIGALPGSSPSRIQGYPQDDGLGDKDSKAERAGLDLP